VEYISLSTVTVVVCHKPALYTAESCWTLKSQVLLLSKFLLITQLLLEKTKKLLMEEYNKGLVLFLNTTKIMIRLIGMTLQVLIGS